MVLDKMLKRWELPAGCIFHSDRRSQYTSGMVKDFLSRRDLLQSSSRIGQPGDNLWSESFFANLKKEAVHYSNSHHPIFFSVWVDFQI
jgi:transposase InsO family protein